MGWLIALGVLILIAMLPIGISALYDAEGPQAIVYVGPIRFFVFPAKKKEKRKKEKKPKKKSTGKGSGNSTTNKKKGGNIQEFFPLVDMVLDFLAAFGKKLRVNNLQMKLILAGGDPSDLAVNYGKGWAALGNLVALLENAFIIKKRDLEVECDFLADSTTIIVNVDVSITVGRVLALLTVQGIPIIRELLRLMKIIKGGAKA